MRVIRAAVGVPAAVCRRRGAPAAAYFFTNAASALLLTAYFVLFDRTSYTKRFVRTTWRLFGAAALLWIAADISAIFGLRLSSSLNLSLLARLQLFITYFGAVLFLGEQKKPHKLIAVILAFAGSIIVMYRPGTAMAVSWGDLLFLVFTVAISISGLFRQGVAGRMPVLLMTYYMYILSVLVLGVLTFLMAPIRAVPVPGFILVNGLFGVVGFVCVNYAIGKAGATYFTVVSCLLPLVTAVFSYLVFGAVPLVSQVAGGLIIIAGIAVFTTRRFV